jgi:hypothetical protein
MAAQPPEQPSWQPVGQDQTQARMWPPPPPSVSEQQAQQPSYTPPGGDGYGYPQPQQPAPGYPPPGYAAPGQEQQGYLGQEQGFGSQDHSQWQLPGMPGVQPGQPRANGEKGFIGSLFDFSFKSFVTPKIIKILYVLFTIWTALVSLLIAIIGFRTGGLVGGLFVLIIIVPIYVLLTLGVWRVVLEAFMVVFRIYEETKKISERSESQV